MTPRVVKLIKEKGDAIVCEAEVGSDGGHAGLIVLEGSGGHKEVLGHTDPTFQTAEEAVKVVEMAVETVRKEASEWSAKPSGKKKARPKKKGE